MRNWCNTWIALRKTHADFQTSQARGAQYWKIGNGRFERLSMRQLAGREEI
jgi:hypothetical protein